MQEFVSCLKGGEIERRAVRSGDTQRKGWSAEN